MDKLAAMIRNKMDTLAEGYDRRLGDIEGYAALPESVRREAARYDLELVASCLEAGDETEFIQFIQTRAGERLAQGFNQEAMLQALAALEETLMPLVTRVEVAKFLWQALTQARTIVSERTTELLRESEQKFKALADNVAVGIFIHQDGIMRYIGREGARILDYDSPAEILDRSILEFLPEAEQARIADIARWRAAGEPVPDHYETRLLRKNGTAIDVLMYGMMIDYEGRPATQGTFIDITEQKRAEEALRQSEQRLALHIQQTPLAIIEWNLDFEVIDWNPAAEAIFGYSQEEALGRHLTGLLVPEEIKEAVDAVLQDLVRQKGGTRNTNENVTKDGRIITCEWYNTPLIDQDGQVIGVTSLALDITERVQLERQIQESLERRSRQVQTSTEVAQEIAAAPALAELFRRVVNLVQERFDYYHAHVYTLEEENLVMQEGTGEAGRQMKATGHKIALASEQSLVARAAREGRTVLVADVFQEPGWLPNPLLPETKAEIAVPIKLRDQVLGVLDAQSDTVGGLSEEDQLLLEGLCGQIASAIDSRQVLEEANIFRQFAEASGQGVGMADLEGQITYMNPTLCRLLGEAKPEDTFGKSFAPYYPEDVQQRLQNEVLPTVMTQGQWAGESMLRSIKGDLIPIIENFFLIRDAQGQPLYLADIVTDISGRKLAEAELEDRLRELQALQQTMSREGWQSFRETADLPAGYLFDRTALHPAGDLWAPEIELAATRQALAAPTGQGKKRQGGGQVAAAPMLIHGELVGTLGIYDDPERPLSADELALVESVSEQVALALESARLFEQTRVALAETEGQAYRLALLSELGRELTQATTINETLTVVASRSLEIMDADRASIALLKPEGDQFELFVLSGLEGVLQTGVELPLAGTMIGRTVRDNRLINVHDSGTSDDLDVRQLHQQGLQSFMAAPLVAGGQVIGTLNVASSGPEAYSERDENLILQVASLLASTLESRRLFEQAQARARREQRLREVTDRIRGSVDVETIMRTAAREVGEVLGRPAFIYLGNGGSGETSPTSVEEEEQ